jgi:DNA-binding NtrC family response regulator
MHGWPGNVRELENVIGHACIMVQGDLVDTPDHPGYLQSPGDAAATPQSVGSEGEVATLEEQERQLIIRAMEQAGGNQSKGARLLRIGRDALRYKLKKHNLETAR